MFYPHVSLYYGESDTRQQKLFEKISAISFADNLFRVSALSLVLHNTVEDHSEWKTIGRVNLSHPEVFLPQANFVDGKFHRSVDAKKSVEHQIDVYNPATGKVITRVPNSGQADVDFSAKAANKAFIKWGLTSGKERAVYLRKIGELIEKKVDELSVLETTDNGKPIEEAKIDILACSQSFIYYADLAEKLDKQQDRPIHSDEAVLDCSVREEPVGVCALIW